MWALQWTKCLVCGRDWSLRLATSTAVRQLTARRSVWALALPTAPPQFDSSEVWVCSCGARLRVGRRRNRARNFVLAGTIALIWGTVCLMTGLVWHHPLLSWFLGVFVVILPLTLSGAGEHEVQVVAASAQP